MCGFGVEVSLCVIGQPISKVFFVTVVTVVVVAVVVPTALTNFLPTSPPSSLSYREIIRDS